MTALQDRFFIPRGGVDPELQRTYGLYRYVPRIGVTVPKYLGYAGAIYGRVSKNGLIDVPQPQPVVVVIKKRRGATSSRNTALVALIERYTFGAPYGLIQLSHEGTARPQRLLDNYSYFLSTFFTNNGAINNRRSGKLPRPILILEVSPGAVLVCSRPLLQVSQPHRIVGIYLPRLLDEQVALLLIESRSFNVLPAFLPH